MIVRTADHRSHYITGAVPAVTGDDIRLYLYNEVVSGQVPGGSRDFHVSNAQLIMTRASARRVLEALRAALSAEEGGTATEVMTIPQDVALGMEKDYEPARKKVQKIRLK
jgi:hypothetical protein